MSTPIIKDYSAMSNEEMRDFLKQGKHKLTLIAPFNQQKFRSAVKGPETAGGYCIGVCLDWARRVLLSSPNRDPGYHNYRLDELDKKDPPAALVKSGLQSHDRMVSAKKDRFDKMDWTNVNEKNPPKGKKARVADSVGLGYKPYSIESKDWSETITGLDEDLVFSHGGKQSKKRFAFLTLIDSFDCAYEKSGGWMSELLGDETTQGCVRPGRVTIAFFRKQDKAKGHAVAIYQQRDDLYLLLDPNLGVFQGGTELSVQRALQFMFAADDPRFIPRYKEDVSKDAPKMTYLILEKKT